MHAALLLVGPPAPVPGKNIPVTRFPVRVRLPAGQPAPLPPAPAADKSPSLVPPAPALPPAAAEGSVDAEPTHFAESSNHYFARGELDVTPVVLDPPDLGGTELSPLLEGRAVLVFYLNERGDVDRLAVEQSTLPESMLAQLEAQREQIKFSPGYKNGVFVKSVVRFEIALGKAAAVTELAPLALP